MQFSKDFPNQLRSQILTSEIISKKVSLKKKGKEYSGLCPFHNEKTPSFSVNDEKGFYHCFGCGAHGDIITFTMENESLSFKDAVIKIANDFNIKIPFLKESENKAIEDKRDRMLKLLELTCQFFSNNLFESEDLSKEALKYLLQRGLNINQIKGLRLGLAVNSYNNLIGYLQKSGFDHEEILSSGVVSKNDNGTIYDKFRNRIIFPITNISGQIIAFGGRILGEGQPKYLNSQETNLFKKGDNLYNFFLAKDSIHKNKFAIIVEGYMDVISLYINGIKNVVAPLGTAITTQQLNILFKSTSNVIICLDGDAAGIKAMQRTIDIALPLINPYKSINFVILPKDSDPDDFIRENGKIKMWNLFKNPVSLSYALFDFEAKNLGINYDNNLLPEQKAKLEASLMQKMELIKDTRSKRYFIQYYRDMLFNLGRKVNNQYKIYKNTTLEKIRVNQLTQEGNLLDKQSNYAIAIISILLNFPDLVDYQDEFCTLKDLEFRNEELATIKEYLVELIDKNKQQDFLKEQLNNFIENKKIKEQIFAVKLFNNDMTNIKNKLQILLLRYFYEEVNKQYKEFLQKTETIETDEVKLKDGKLKELFDYKSFLEKKIISLEVI